LSAAAPFPALWRKGGAEGWALLAAPRGKGAPQADLQRAELTLIERVKNGERELFHELIRPCQRSVYLAAFSILGNEADAEEAAQDAILKAFKNLRQFRADSRFSTWLVRIAINEARMQRRKNRKGLFEPLEQTREDEEGNYTPRDFADWREIPSEALERRELRDALAEALASLPEKYRAVFVLRDVQQLNIAEAARVLGVSEAAVKTRLLRARLRMRDCLAPGWGRLVAAGSRK